MYYWQQGQALDNGKYVVENLLGAGGYGVTYKVKNTSNNKFFTIKTLNIQCHWNDSLEKLREKFINEIISVANCRHPNIVRVYSQVFSENEFPCMVMDYIEGKDLAELLETTGKFSELKAINLICKVGEALSYVHHQGFLHRDIKPANILLRKSDSSPVLIDFGLAREYDLKGLRSMTNAKTEGFAPIEQYERNGNFGAWTDVYALAATLYALVTAELPLPALYRTAAPLIPPQVHNPNLSDRINEAILQGMELKSENRPQSVELWLNLLQPGVSPSQKPNSLSPDIQKGESHKRIQEKVKESIAKIKLTNNNFDSHSQLRALLKNKQWKQADYETIQIFLNLTKRQKYGSLRSKDIDNISNLDLLHIDSLWLKASDYNFGFSVQRAIWQKQLGLKLKSPQFNNQENIRNFAHLVGWYENDELLKNRDRYQFSLDAPQGHLPSLRFPCSEFPDMNWWQSWKRIFSSFLLQTEKCLLN